MEVLKPMVFVPSGQVAIEASQAMTQEEKIKIIELYGSDAGEFVLECELTESEKGMIDMMNESLTKS